MYVLQQSLLDLVERIGAEVPLPGARPPQEACADLRMHAELLDVGYGPCAGECKGPKTNRVLLLRRRFEEPTRQNGTV